MKNKILKISLLLGSIYFFSMAIAHISGKKIPGLFIYFNVPSYPYQDKIISALSFGWSIFFFSAFLSLSKTIIKSILSAGAVAIIMLCFINCSTDFKSLSVNINVNSFYIETALLFIYWLWLLIWYNKSNKNL